MKKKKPSFLNIIEKAIASDTNAHPTVLRKIVANAAGKRKPPSKEESKKRRKLILEAMSSSEE